MYQRTLNKLRRLMSIHAFELSSSYGTVIFSKNFCFSHFSGVLFSFSLNFCAILSAQQYKNKSQKWFQYKSFFSVYFK